MKKRMLMLMAVVLFIASNLFAANGDLIVDGNVGIGTTNNPAAKLDVVGTAGTNKMVTFTGTNNRRVAIFNNTLTDDTQPFGVTLDVSANQSGGVAGITGMNGVIALTHNSTKSGVPGGSATNFTFQIGSDTGSGIVDIDSVSGFTYTLNRRWNISTGLTYNVANSYGALFKIQDGGPSGNTFGVVNVTNHYGNYIADYVNSGTRRVNIANLTGLYIEKLIGGGVSNAGIVLAGDGAGADLVLGSNKETKLYGNAGDFIIDTMGNVGIGMDSPIHPLEMASGAHVTAGGVWTDASSRDYKENITDLSAEKAIDTLNKLKPVEFNYKVDKEEKYAGFIAEDVPEMVAMKDRKGLSPMDIVAVLTSVVKDQQKTIEELKEKVQKLEAKDLVASVQN